MTPNDANIYLPGTIQIPSALQVFDITQSYPMVVTVQADTLIASNTYREGQIVKFTIPYSYGMQQLNGKTAKILLVNNDEFYMDVNSSNFDPFISPLSDSQASIAPAGSQNLEYIDNRMTKVPFQSLNNRGN